MGCVAGKLHLFSYKNSIPGAWSITQKNFLPTYHRPSYNDKDTHSLLIESFPGRKYHDVGSMQKRPKVKGYEYF